MSASKRRSWRWSLVALPAACVAWSASARATVGTDCWPKLTPNAQTLPANTPFRLTFLTRPDSDPATTISLARLDDSGLVDVPLTVSPIDAAGLGYSVTPTMLTALAAYRFEFRTNCNEAPIRRYFGVTPEAPFPSVLGELSTMPARQVGSDDTWLVIEMPLKLDPSVLPWEYLYVVESFLDGAPHDRPGTAVAYVANHPVHGSYKFSACNKTDRRVTEGRHTVQLVGKPAGFDAPEIVSNTVTVDIQCPPDPPDPPDPGARPGDSASSDGGRGCSTGFALPSNSVLAFGVFGFLGLVLTCRRTRRY